MKILTEGDNEKGFMVNYKHRDVLEKHMCFAKIEEEWYICTHLRWQNIL